VMLQAARTAIDERRETGELTVDALNAEELVGETLIRAFDGRERYAPKKMSLRAWLLALQLRSLNRLAKAESSYRERKAISLDQEVPFREDYDAVEETFYEFNDPFDVTTYEELFPSQAPADVEIDTRRPLTPEEHDYIRQSGLDPSRRQVVEMHDEFDLDISEVAQIMGQSLQDVAESLNAARMHVRQWIGSTDESEITAGDDDIDSYTGERL
jgi:DNA-directed RNA polymerase specialized sigma24 family protein